MIARTTKGLEDTCSEAVVVFKTVEDTLRSVLDTFEHSEHASRTVLQFSFDNMSTAHFGRSIKLKHYVIN